MNISSFNLLLKIQEYRSLSDAATALNYTQSAVSYALKEIENEWGVTLFTRGKKGVIPTSEYMRLLPNIREISKAQENFKKSLDSLRGLESGCVSIGTFNSVSTHILPPILKMYRSAHPNITFHLMNGTYSEIQQWLLNGSIEIGFLETPVPRGLEAIPVCRDRLVVALPLDHPLVHCTSFPTIKLHSEPYIATLGGSDSGIRHILEQNKIPLNIVLTANGDCETLAMVESGIGITIFPELLLHRTDFKVHICPLDYPMERELSIAYVSQNTLSCAASYFVDTLLRFKQDWGAGLPLTFL